MKPGRIGSFVVLLVMAFAAATAQAITITNFSAGLPGGSNPYAVAPSSNGLIWFNDFVSGGEFLGASTLTGHIALLPSQHSAEHMTEGPDGNTWFTDESGAIGRISHTGVVTEFSQGLNAHSRPYNLTAGPDGNVWFTDWGCENGGTCAVGRITPAGVITEYTVPGAAWGITSGPQHDIWISLDNGIDRVSPSGAITPVPVPGMFSDALVAGSDGNLWFPFKGISRMTPSGHLTSFSHGLQTNSAPAWFALGADGNVWFGDIACQISTSPCAMARVTPSGAITEFTTGLAAGTEPFNPASGPDGSLWFAEQPRSTGTGAIGKLNFDLPARVQTGAHRNVKQTTATVYGAVDPIGSTVTNIYVAWGRSTRYHHTVEANPARLAPSGNYVPVTINLKNLPPNTTIHYRLVAINAFGKSVGSDRTFKTKKKKKRHRK